MKTLSTCLLLAMVAFFCFPTLASAQSEKVERKIVITKHYVDKEGSEVSETIIKKGKAAENFNADSYIRENNSDSVFVEVKIVQNEDAKDESDSDANEDNSMQYRFSDDDFDNNQRAMLGVEPYSNKNKDLPGVPVKVMRCAPAEKAGLQTGDKIVMLNGKQTNSWDDLVKILRKTKPGDQVVIQYNRNNTTRTTQANIESRDAVYEAQSKCKKGFLGVEPSDNRANKNTNGVAVNVIKNAAASKAGLENGDQILKLNQRSISTWDDLSEFMEGTKAGDQIEITYVRNGQVNTLRTIIGEEKSWDWDNWNTDNWNWEGFNVDVKEKDACLGVYTKDFKTGENDVEGGALIQGFTDSSAAEVAKLQKGDIITAINAKNVQNQDDLWNEIAQYKEGDKVKIDFLRNGQKMQAEAVLKPCKDNSNKIVLDNTDEAGNSQRRQFMIWNWGPNEQTRMREMHVITIHKGEGDGQKVNPVPNDRVLKLDNFKAYPNPTSAQVTVAFRAPSAPTIVSLIDAAGRQLFREELNAFNGEYIQQFDLTEHAKGTVIIQVVQGDKVYSDQIIVN